MMSWSKQLPTERASEMLAEQLALCLKPPLVLTFRGEIGAGKTTFIRAMLRRLGVSFAIKSPTFSLVESYECSSFVVHHFDLYRIHDVTELDYLGFRDFFVENTVCCIEWPEQAGEYLTSVDVEFTLTMQVTGRKLQARALSSTGVAMLSCFVEES